MDGKRLIAFFITLAGISLFCATAFAHHGVQGYTRGEDTRITINGTVRSFRWANPHAQLYLDETLENGEVRTWGFELNSPGNLTRRGGWTHNALKAGDVVTARFNPAEGGRLAGACLAIERADGTRLISGQGCNGYDNN